MPFTKEELVTLKKYGDRSLQTIRLLEMGAGQFETLRKLWSLFDLLIAGLLGVLLLVLGEGLVSPELNRWGEVVGIVSLGLSQLLDKLLMLFRLETKSSEFRAVSLELRKFTARIEKILIAHSAQRPSSDVMDELVDTYYALTATVPALPFWLQPGVIGRFVAGNSVMFEARSLQRHENTLGRPARVRTPLPKDFATPPNTLVRKNSGTQFTFPPATADIESTAAEIVESALGPVA